MKSKNTKKVREKKNFQAYWTMVEMKTTSSNCRLKVKKLYNNDMILFLMHNIIHNISYIYVIILNTKIFKMINIVV